MNKTISLVFLLILSALRTFGQDQVEMADQLRSEGKIYVVVAIILIILLGLFFYLFSLDRKVKKLEKLLSEKKKQTN
jgi:CcmD family protein